MQQLTLDFAPRPVPPPRRVSLPVVKASMAVPSPLVAVADAFDLRLDEDSFADELFALGPFPARETPSTIRPRLRSQCASGPRPCPWVSCRYHLFLDVRADGSLKLNFPQKEPDELTVTCSLDLAEDGPRTLDSIAAIMGMSKERARQLESEAFDKLYVALPRAIGAGMSIEEEWI